MNKRFELSEQEIDILLERSASDNNGWRMLEKLAFYPLSERAKKLFIRAASPDDRCRYDCGDAITYFLANQTLAEEFIREFVPLREIEGNISTIAFYQFVSEKFLREFCPTLLSEDTIWAICNGRSSCNLSEDFIREITSQEEED